MASERDETEAGSSWQNLTFWTMILIMCVAGGFYFWHFLRALPDQERISECTRSCEAMHAEFEDVTRYGCFCADQDIPFVLEAGQVGVDCE